MRTIWLASTALFMTTAAALAQSAVTSSPAPTGAVSAPQQSPAAASPGKASPAPSGSPAMSMSPTDKATASPAPNGAVSAPSAAPGKPEMAPGKLAPATPKSEKTSETAAPKPANAHAAPHRWSYRMVASSRLPPDASAAQYLQIAGQAIKHHDTAQADDALSHAETRLLDRSVPKGEIGADTSPAVQSIETAVQALHAGNYMKASAATKQAAGASGGM